MEIWQFDKGVPNKNDEVPFCQDKKTKKCYAEELWDKELRNEVENARCGKESLSDKIYEITNYESPIEPTLINSWANYGNPYSTVGYWKDSLGYIHLKGTVKGGTTGTIIFILPEGYRPLNKIGFTVSSDGKAGVILVCVNAVEIDDIGNVFAIHSNTYMSLDGISFRVGV